MQGQQRKGRGRGRGDILRTAHRRCSVLCSMPPWIRGGCARSGLGGRCGLLTPGLQNHFSVVRLLCNPQSESDSEDEDSDQEEEQKEEQQGQERGRDEEQQQEDDGGFEAPEPAPAPGGVGGSGGNDDVL